MDFLKKGFTRFQKIFSIWVPVYSYLWYCYRYLVYISIVTSNSHLWWWWWWCRWFGLTRNWCCLQESDLDELKLSDDIEVCLFVFCCFWISAIWLAYSEAVISWPRGFRPLSNILDSLTPMKKCFNLLKGHLLLNKFGFFEALQLHTVPLELKNL